MAAVHLAYADLALDKFSRTDVDKDAESFIQLIERKNNFAPWGAPANPNALANYTFRKKAMFPSLLIDPAAEWYENIIEAATPWEDIRINFITRFSDRRNKFRHRMEIERCIGRDGEKFRSFVRIIKQNLDKSWPDNMSGIAGPRKAAERAAQSRHRRQRYNDYCLRGLRPRYLQRIAQEFLVECANATWKNFCNQINQKDLLLEVTSTFFILWRTNQSRTGNTWTEDKKYSIGFERI